MSDELPEGWTSTSFTEAVAPDAPIQYGILQPGPDVLGGIPYVRPTEIQDDKIDIGSLRRTTAEIAAKYQRASLKTGDVLLSIVGSIGKVAIVPAELDGANITQSSARLRPRAGVVSPAYMAWFLRSSLATKQYDELTLGTGVPRLNIGDIRSMSIPLAPLNEQRRIVADVEVLMAEGATVRARLAKVSRILKRFRQAALAAACSGRLTEGWRRTRPSLTSLRVLLDKLADSDDARTVRRGVPEAVEPPDHIETLETPEAWAKASVAELLKCGALKDVKDGNHGANHPKVAELTNEGLAFITAAQVRDYKIDYDSAWKISGAALEKLRVGFAEPNDAVLTHKGSVGRAALCDRECILTPQTTYYRCNDKVVYPLYLVYFFTSPQFYKQLAATMSQTTRDFVPISEQYRLFLILPPLAEQQEIVRRVSSLFALADAIERRVSLATARAQKLPQAILAKAFRGELVPTEAELARQEGRSFEPASALLARIRAEREAAGAEAGGKRAKPPTAAKRAGARAKGSPAG
jgi:type I restriction enzyme, S subunit